MKKKSVEFEKEREREKEKAIWGEQSKSCIDLCDLHIAKQK